MYYIVEAVTLKWPVFVGVLILSLFSQHCEFRMRGHYHCLRPGCFFVTNITTKLPWHIKKHEKAERRAANGFKYFTKREECGRLGENYTSHNASLLTFTELFNSK